MVLLSDLQYIRDIKKITTITDLAKLKIIISYISSDCVNCHIAHFYRPL